MKINKKALGIVLVLGGVGLMAGAGFAGWKGEIWRLALTGESLTPTTSWRAEPIVPTAPPVGSSIPGRQPSTGAMSTWTKAPRITPSRQLDPPTSTSSPTLLLATPGVAPTSPSMLVTALSRFGVGAPAPYLSLFETQAAEELSLGWYLTWSVLETPPGPAGVEFWQMIRLSEEGFVPDRETIQRVAQANPGTTWLIGNEPDVRWQDNVTPARYAEAYYELYQLLKEADPTCRVAIGGVSQPTPLRLEYLEMVLASYQERYAEPMPVDVWNVHNFILREERDGWGVGIPPGMATDQGVLFEVGDHDDLEVFQAQIFDFRRWMADHGQRHKPLIVSEYGILMPEDYGFPLERVERFMYDTYDFMLNATNHQTGYPADGNRLVQRWAWYSLGDDVYPTGNLIDLDTGDLTGIGQAHQEFISRLQ
jgi:hypothetical protein